MSSQRKINILGIDTSCDDTSIAVLEARGNQSKILSNLVSSQVKIHRKWGGVYPALAKREHQKNLVPVLIRALKKAKLLKKTKSKKRNLKLEALKKILIREETLLKPLKSFLLQYQKPNINLLAVTVGPGLEPCLWVGVNFAKALSCCWNLPLIPINHIEAHILANWLRPVVKISNSQISNSKNLFPAISLVVSGGHTQLILMRDFGRHPPSTQYKILGETRDDAAGECLDKVARILGLGYPGGPIIYKLAKKCTNGGSPSINLPRPMIHQKNYDFSFSGLKTAVLYDFKSRNPKIRKSKKYLQKMAKETQQAIIDVLIAKTIKVAKNYQAKTIILGGGVAANQELRKQLQQKARTNFKLLIPPKNLSTDNGAMVAEAAYFHWLSNQIPPKVEVNANLRV